MTKTPQRPPQKQPAKPARRIHPTIEALASVDWLRQIQRVTVFLRELRGDAHERINQDHTAELVRAQRVRTSVDAFARNVVGREPTETAQPRKDH